MADGALELTALKRAGDGVSAGRGLLGRKPRIIRLREVLLTPAKKVESPRFSKEWTM